MLPTAIRRATGSLGQEKGFYRIPQGFTECEIGHWPTVPTLIRGFAQPEVPFDFSHFRERAKIYSTME